MRFCVLGALAVEGVDGTPIEIGARKRRALLAALLLEGGRPVSAERLIDLLWGDEPPPAAVESLHAHVSRLRRDLGNGAVQTTSAGYLLDATPGSIDYRVFEDQVQAGRRLIAQGAWGEASRVLDEALGLWRGPALVDVFDAPFAARAAARLEDLREGAVEDRIEAELALGRHAEVLAELEAVTTETPLRERPWGQLMLALYRSGRQADALAAYRRARRLLRDELGIDPSPQLQELEVRILQQDPTLLAGAQRQPTVRLPVPLTPILGRSDLLERATTQLRDGRLVSLIGPGGVGKTRLSIAVGEALVPRQSGGVVFVDLSAVRDPNLVISRIGELTGGGEQPGNVIGDAAMLLVLDNFEQVLEAARPVVRLLEACRNLRVLVTSRAPLHVRGEAIIDVPPLSVADASQLFVERARAVMASAILDPTLVEEIVRRLDGLPLALELAAARTRLVATAHVRDRLADQLALLVGGMRDAPDRHQTLRDTIAWSYELLSPPSRGVFRKLSVLAGDFTLDAAAAIGESDTDGVGELLDQSLLRRVGDRFAMLDSIHAFAADEADRHDETVASRDRHLAHFVEQSDDDRMPRGPGETIAQAWTRFVHAERANLTRAFEWALERGDDQAAWQLFHTLGMYFVRTGAIDEGSAMAERALAVARRLGPEEELSALAIASEFPRFGGQLRVGLERKREALELARRSGTPLQLATTLDDTACILGELGEFDEAECLLTEALAVRDANPSADPLEPAHSWGTAAEVALRAGRLVDAERRMAEAVAIEAVSDPWPSWIVEQDHLKGRIDLAAGRTADARQRFERSVRGGVEIAFRAMVANSLDGLASIRFAEDPRLAAELVGMADRVRAEARAPAWDGAARDRLVVDLSERLGEEELTRLRAIGHALPMGAMPERIEPALASA